MKGVSTPYPSQPLTQEPHSGGGRRLPLVSLDQQTVMMSRLRTAAMTTPSGAHVIHVLILALTSGTC